MTRHLHSRLVAAGYDVRKVTDLARGGEASVLRLELVDGRCVKLRQYPSPEAADRVWSSLRHAKGVTLPLPLIRLGNTMVTEYVEGEPLDRYLRRATAADRRNMVRRVAWLAANLHKISGTRGRPRLPTEHRQLITVVARRLGRRRLLDRGTVAALTGLTLPPAVRYVSTHGDLHPDNIVVEPSRRLRAVDEERIDKRPAAFDLARIVMRWPLDVGLEHALLTAYDRAGGDSRHYRDHRTFWIAVALSTSAVYRLYYALPGLRPVASELRRLVT